MEKTDAIHLAFRAADFVRHPIAVCGARYVLPFAEPARDPGAARWTVTPRPDAGLWCPGLACTGFGASVGIPAADVPSDAVRPFVHELAYPPLMAAVIAGRLAPAQRPETDEQLLSRRPVIHTGAMLLDRVALGSAAEYRTTSLCWAVDAALGGI